MFDVPRIIDGSKAVQRSDASRPERLEGLDVDTYLGVSRSGKGKIAQGLEADAFRVVQPFEYCWTSHEQRSAACQTYRGPVAWKHRMGFGNMFDNCVESREDTPL